MSTTESVNVRRNNVVFTDAAPKPLPVFSQAIKTKDTIYVSGTVGIDPHTGDLVSGDIKEQTSQVLKNMKVVLEVAGSGLGRVVKVNVFVTDMRNFEAMNEAYTGAFEDPQPVEFLPNPTLLFLGDLGRQRSW
ncbi:endoribonuclease L-PSP [Cladophialophora psammophila CBS 110553]|uniref:Endoribonuclease L-PSP n=1 Tax=Cladophialophora psammophila CBS 110553 TaxID=1182543 RepID=W9XDQ4_9EURO|nr:endoribonuclease L-PSP [Cladophialophora psammophila CBS 110553]EXJ75096.1 endoribonuclease L-PSP [Cladophialophora psammophila CBS 110553]